MVRRSTVDRSPNSTEHGLDYKLGTQYSEPDGIAASHRQRRLSGSGGRWLIWAFRVLAWGILLLIRFRGVRAILTDETHPAAPARIPAGTQPAGFPVTLADAYALQFGEVYLNYSAHITQQRGNQLSAFLPPGTDPQLRRNGKDTSQLQFEQVAAIKVRDAHHAVVTLLTCVNRVLMRLGVPIYASSSGHLVVTSAPAWLPPPAQCTLATASDSATRTVLTNQLPAFFQAYASGNEVTLGRFLTPGPALTDQQLGGSTRHTFILPARRAGGEDLEGGVPHLRQMSYGLAAVRRNGSLYVKDISTPNQGYTRNEW
jgi:hypothetical protein